MNESDNNVGTVGRVAEQLWSYWPIAANAGGAVILAFSTSLITKFPEILDFERWQTKVEWLGMVLFLVGSISLSKSSRQTLRFQGENRQLQSLIRRLGDDIQDKCQTLLIQILEELELTNDYRISLYKHDESNFIMLARFSPDPVKRKTGRGFYPDDQGCIGEAYRDEECIEQDLPEFGSQEYFEIMQERWGIDPNVTAAFTMQSRSIAAFSISNKETYERPLVIVFECIKPKAFRVRKLRSTCKSYADTLCGLADAHAQLLPSISFAKDRGF